MKHAFFILFVVLLSFSCKKQNSKVDLTEFIVGEYFINGDSSNGLISIEKINNNTINIDVVDYFNSIVRNYNFAAILNSDNSFTLNQYIYRSSPFILTLGQSCYVDYYLSGSGVYSDNEIFLYIERRTKPYNTSSCPQYMSVYNTVLEFTTVGNAL